MHWHSLLPWHTAGYCWSCCLPRTPGNFRRAGSWCSYFVARACYFPSVGPCLCWMSWDSCWSVPPGPSGRQTCPWVVLNGSPSLVSFANLRVHYIAFSWSLPNRTGYRTDTFVILPVAQLEAEYEPLTIKFWTWTYNKLFNHLDQNVPIWIWECCARQCWKPYWSK